MIERIESTRSKIAFQLGLQAGLRESECFALTWSDIDFEKKKSRSANSFSIRISSGALHR